MTCTAIALNRSEAPLSVMPQQRPVQRYSKLEPVDILLVEDNASDVMLAETALDAARIHYDLHTLGDGMHVLPYLHRHGMYSDERRPDMILLDLSLPGMDGFEVLAEMASQPGRFSDIPIIILTGDQHCAFLRCSYDLNIAAYIPKPCSQDKIRSAFAALRRQSLSGGNKRSRRIPASPGKIPRT